MRGLIFGIAGLLLLASPGICQVDTLQLVEIGSIEAPAEITDLYVEDLDGDSLKEIILTTATNIHIYNGITYEEIWTSPELINPQDLLFEDINNDGLIDLSVRDSLNIALFDPLNSETIWTSPPIESTYSCYTMGDRNGDGSFDVALVTTDSYEWSSFDTIRVIVYLGPGYELQDSFHFILISYGDIGSDPNVWDEYHEWVRSILITEITSSNGLQRVIAIFSHIYAYDHWMPIEIFWVSGNILLFDANNFDSIFASTIGLASYSCTEQHEDAVLLDALTFSEYYDSGYQTNSGYVSSVSSDSLFSYSRFWFSNPSNNCEFKGYALGEINYDSPGRELSYGSCDSLFLLSFPDVVLLWVTAIETHLESVQFLYNAQSIFNTPQIICQIGDPPIDYRFYSGPDGSLTAVLPDYGYPISNVDDLNSDGNDEILSVDENILFIYGLQRTGIEDQSVLPDRPFFLSNYPNPFNSTTTIEYGLPQAGHVTIEVYDLLGRKVEMLVDEEKEAGHHRVIWDAQSQPSGVYFYRLTAANLAETKRMVLLK